MKKVFTIFSYEDNEVKDVVATHKEAKEWVLENREGNEDDCRIEEWNVDFEEEK